MFLTRADAEAGGNAFCQQAQGTSNELGNVSMSHCHHVGDGQTPRGEMMPIARGVVP